MEWGQGQGRSRRNSTFGCGAFKLLGELCRYRSPLSRIVKRLILLATDPEMMKQHCQLACDGDNRPSLSSLASALRKFQSPSAQIGVLSEGTQDVLRSLHQNHAQIGITLPGDM